MYSHPDLLKVIGWGGVVGWFEILVTAQVLGFGTWIGLSILNYFYITILNVEKFFGFFDSDDEV